MFKHTRLYCIEKEIIERLNKLNGTKWNIFLSIRIENFTIALSDDWKAHAIREGV